MHLSWALGTLMRIIIFSIIILFSIPAYSDMPDWYKRDIVKFVRNAEAVILYKIVKVTRLPKKNEHLYSYRIDTETIEELKGSTPKGNCYMSYAEEINDEMYKVGEKRLVILSINYISDCGVIETLQGAPGTKEYIAYFKSIINNGT
jgi:hypothetical protein